MKAYFFYKLFTSPGLSSLISMLLQSLTTFLLTTTTTFLSFTAASSFHTTDAALVTNSISTRDEIITLEAPSSQTRLSYCPLCRVNPPNHRTLCSHDLCLHCHYNRINAEKYNCYICSKDVLKSIFNVISERDTPSLPLYLRQVRNTIDLFKTPLHCAIMVDYIDAVTILAPISSLSATDEMGKTILTCAINQGNIDVINILLDNGAPIDEEDLNEDTPMAIAIYSGRIDIIHLLIERGASVTSNILTLLNISKEAIEVCIEEEDGIGIERYNEIYEFFSKL